MTTDLLIEVWEDQNGQSMGPVNEHNDKTRSSNEVLVHSFRARSFTEAKHIYNLWCGADSILSDDAFDDPFTEKMRDDQDEYLQRRILTK